MTNLSPSAVLEMGARDLEDIRLHLCPADVLSGVLVVIDLNNEHTREERGESATAGRCPSLEASVERVESSTYLVQPLSVGKQTYFSLNNKWQRPTIYYKGDCFHYALLTVYFPQVCFGDVYTFSDMGRQFFSNYVW